MQRPRVVEDAGAVEGVPASGIQDIPFSEEKPQGTRLGGRQPITDGPSSFEPGGAACGRVRLEAKRRVRFRRSRLMRAWK